MNVREELIDINKTLDKWWEVMYNVVSVYNACVRRRIFMSNCPRP